MRGSKTVPPQILREISLIGSIVLVGLRGTAPRPHDPQPRVLLLYYSPTFIHDIMNREKRSSENEFVKEKK